MTYISEILNSMETLQQFQQERMFGRVDCDSEMAIVLPVNENGLPIVAYY